MYKSSNPILRDLIGLSSSLLQHPANQYQSHGRLHHVFCSCVFVFLNVGILGRKKMFTPDKTLIKIRGYETTYDPTFLCFQDGWHAVFTLVHYKQCYNLHYRIIVKYSLKVVQNDKIVTCNLLPTTTKTINYSLSWPRNPLTLRNTNTIHKPCGKLLPKLILSRI